MKKSLSRPAKGDSLSATDHKGRYGQVRQRTLDICAPLAPEDYPIQPAPHVSPPKWHLAHTTWFYEHFILTAHLPGYAVFHKDFSFLFNSYYESVGAHLLQGHRGAMSRPTLEEIIAYRSHVDDAMAALLERPSADDERISELLEIGLQHEMQHQELLFSDIKYILGHNPLFPVYHLDARADRPGVVADRGWIEMPEGMYDIGHKGKGFSFDNEHAAHRVFLQGYAISKAPVTYGDYFDFIEDGGYRNFRHWHSEGWEWVKSTGRNAPLYIHRIDGTWKRYTLSGLVECHLDCPVMHVNYYEAAAFASWKGERLPTEFEWEAASARFAWGQSWEWTNSAYLPYPGYVQPQGAVGEYNGKFMVNQMVLRGASPATFPGHSRPTYRNFFHPHFQWQFTGIRTAKQ